jgi:hypothetical protein
MKCQDVEAPRQIEALGDEAVYAESHVDVSCSGWLSFDKPCNEACLNGKRHAELERQGV